MRVVSETNNYHGAWKHEKGFPTSMVIREHVKGMTLSKEVLGKPFLSHPHSFITPHTFYEVQSMNMNILYT